MSVCAFVCLSACVSARVSMSLWYLAVVTSLIAMTAIVGSMLHSCTKAVAVLSTSTSKLLPCPGHVVEVLWLSLKVFCNRAW